MKKEDLTDREQKKFKVMPGKESQCMTCLFYNDNKQCPAFSSIPDDIFSGKSKHDKAVANQDIKDIVYKYDIKNDLPEL